MPNQIPDTQTIRTVRDRLSASPVLLVACDYDGTLSHLVPQHEDASTHPESLAALLKLSQLPHTHVAIISGRPRALLQQRFTSAPNIELIGSHGAEAGDLVPPPVQPRLEQERERIVGSLKNIAKTVPGVRIEFKPRGVAFHYRGAPESAVGHVMDLMGSVLRGVQHMTVRLGSMVVEFASDRTNKGIALAALREKVGATAVLFVGDDLTDEHAFQVLTQRDASVKVGRGETRAHFRVSDVDAVSQLLTNLAEERATWLAHRPLVPLQNLSAIGDLRTIAIVDPRGRIVWLCLPRLDSPALFASLLGTNAHGHFSIEPLNAEGTPEQQHTEGSLVLRTKWRDLTITDYFDCSAGRAYQRSGRCDLIRVIEGTGRAKITFAPRYDFGRIATKLALKENGIEVEGSADNISLYSPGVSWTIKKDGQHDTAEATVDAASNHVLELRYGSPSTRAHPQTETQRRAATDQFWKSWNASIQASGKHDALLRKCALMLRCLNYGPSGAIAAAATTSLPEHLGGTRNWDYRFCWPRDSALTCSALMKLGNTGVALRYLDWLSGVVDHCESPDQLRPVYTLLGSDLGTEGEVSELDGYGGSKPVRIGNAAAQQVQLDVFGPIVDLIASLAERGAPLTADHWRLVRAMVDAVETRWREPDHGIWELRGPRRHHVHTKAMCFLTVDRAIALHALEIETQPTAWLKLREEIRQDVLSNGYNDAAKSFTTAYESTELDAASLHVGLTGLVDVKDSRWANTVDATLQHLCTGSVVRRYLFSDNLPGKEGGFHICTGWLIESLLTLGRVQEAEHLLDQMLRHIGPTGMLSEQHDDQYQIALGNLPQAYSYIGVINAIKAVERVHAGGHST